MNRTSTIDWRVSWWRSTPGVTELEGGLEADRSEIQRLLADMERMTQIVVAATAAEPTRRSA